MSKNIKYTLDKVIINPFLLDHYIFTGKSSLLHGIMVIGYLILTFLDTFTFNIYKCLVTGAEFAVFSSRGRGVMKQSGVCGDPNIQILLTWYSL